MVFEKLIRKVRSHNIPIIIGACAVVLVVGVILYSVIATHYHKSESAKNTIYDASLLRVTSVKTPQDMIRLYGYRYNDIEKSVQAASYTKWDKTMLDKAYFCLLYEDKLGLFTQVYKTLNMIEYERRGGLNIDDNSFNINQGDRTAIKKRADVAAKKAPGSS